MAHYFKKKEKTEQGRLFTMDEFLEDWKETRTRHPGQKQILKSVFEDNKKRIFIRAGRKGAKSGTNIEIAWRCAWAKPGAVIYFCFPTITQAVEVVWDERRLQTCDCPQDDYMFENYVNRVDESKHILWFKNNSHIKLIGTWSEARGRGTQPDVLIVDEVQDCSSDYLDAMNPNLAAKDGLLVMCGTPPRKRNHYHDWESRIKIDPDGAAFHFNSYINDQVPHLAKWLDKERDILIKTNREDVWIREYLAEDCFSSADRVLPDAKFMEHAEIVKKARIWPNEHLVPIMATLVHGNYISCVWGLMAARKHLYVLDCEIVNQLWDKSFAKLYENILGKVKEFSDIFNFHHKRIAGSWRKLLHDPTDSFRDVIQGFTNCRTDLKWQERGVPLLREMMLNGSITMSDRITPIGLECQNYLIEDKIKEVEKNYPIVCSVCMMVNEYFQLENITVEKEQQFDKYAPLRNMGLLIPPEKKKGKSLFSRNW